MNALRIHRFLLQVTVALFLGQALRNLFLLGLLCIDLLFFTGCGFKSPPRPLQEKVPPPFFAPPQVSYRDSRLRLSWVIEETGQKLLKELKETEVEKIPGLLIQEFRGAEKCPDCDDGWFSNREIPLNSKRFIVEEDHLFLYDPLVPQVVGHDLKRLRLKWQVDEEALQVPVILNLPPRPVFPPPVAIEAQLVPDSIIFLEQTFEFGKDQLGKDAGPGVPDGTAGSTPFRNPEADRQERLEGGMSSSASQNHETAYHRRYTYRISWPETRETLYRRFSGSGEITHLTRAYRANIYLLDASGKAPELPLNPEPLNTPSYLLERNVLISMPGPPVRDADTHPWILPTSVAFYIDLHGEKEDIFKLTLRLVDALGNEGMSSPPVNIFLPRVTVAELSWGARIISPSVY